MQWPQNNSYAVWWQAHSPCMEVSIASTAGHTISRQRVVGRNDGANNLCNALPEDFWLKRAFSFCQTVFPLSVGRMEVLRQAMLRKQQHNPLRGIQSDVFTLMMVDGGFIIWVDRNLIVRPLSTSASRTRGFQTHSPRRVPSTGCTVKASSNEQSCMRRTLLSVQ